MRHPSTKTNPLGPWDQRLADALSRLCERVGQGEKLRWEDVAHEYPDLAEDLYPLWGTVLLADVIGSFSPTDDGPAPSGQVAPAGFQLPAEFGDYELIEELGRGGMGIVYRARQLSLGREVALKMLLRGQLASADDATRFRQEAQAAARLQHPGIVPVYEVGEHDGQLFFSMQYVPGQTLSRLLEAGPLPSRHAARIAAAVSRAVEAAHGHGVLHRDLKPSNILIDPDGAPHITDFGLARRVADVDSLTKTGAALGTPAYMAPEQAVGNRGRLGPATDVYGIGGVLYHMLTGRPPFQAASPVDVLFMLLEQEPLPPRMLNPKVDRDLAMIALRCLQKPADLRYPTAGALAEDLEAYLADEPVAARSGHFRHIIARWFRETHHAVILQNWGVLWMWHSLVLLVVCALTNLLQALGDQQRIHYFLLWTAGLGTWAAVFWTLRRCQGPVTFVERQIAHIWAASMISIAGLFPVEYVMGLPVLTLSPVLGLSSGMVFLIKAGMLTGTFYIQAGALFATALAMARWPQVAHLIFGVVSALCFFIPGWKYYRSRVQSSEFGAQRGSRGDDA